MYPIKFPDSLDEAAFLKEYWQQKPLFMPGAWPEFENPLPAEELAGLALEGAFPSRIIEQHSADKWSLRQGPFSENDFTALSGKRWSLLITDIEKYLPDFMQYVQPFRFIPDWRFDDLMISYAPPGGSVGPHLDDYDVFLIQAQGERSWELEGEFRELPSADKELIPGTDLRLIKKFETRYTYLCEPGDILYLPPRLGHHGIAKTECMTWSMGFKAPCFNDMLIDYLEEFETINQHKRFTDPGLVSQQYSGEITGLQLKQLKSWFIKQINENDETFVRWAAKFLSGDVASDEMSLDVEPLDENTVNVEPNPFVRFDFIRLEGQTYLYAGGVEYKVSLALAKKLTTKGQISLPLRSGYDKALILKMLKNEHLLRVE